MAIEKMKTLKELIAEYAFLLQKSFEDNSRLKELKSDFNIQCLMEVIEKDKKTLKKIKEEILLRFDD